MEIQHKHPPTIRGQTEQVVLAHLAAFYDAPDHGKLSALTALLEWYIEQAETK